MSNTILPIHNPYGKYFSINLEDYKDLIDEINESYDQIVASMNITDDRIMRPKTETIAHEIFITNSIEGELDSPFLILDEIRKYDEDPTYSSKRIINLYRAYVKISEEKIITPETLNDLYLTITDGLLSKSDNATMQSALIEQGRVSRTGDVFIDGGSKGMEKQMEDYEAEEQMRSVIDFAYNLSTNESPGFSYIMGQLLHFMIVYIHPYLDGNGRTARTVACWETLNNDNISGNIGNRGIEENRRAYYTAIEETIKHTNINYFIKLMIKLLQIELKKEYIITKLQEYTGYELTPEEYIVINYILMTRGRKTFADLIIRYSQLTRSKGDKKVIKEIFEQLVDKGFVEVEGSTKNGENIFFDLPEEIRDLPEYEEATSRPRKY